MACTPESFQASITLPWSSIVGVGTAVRLVVPIPTGAPQDRLTWLYRATYIVPIQVPFTVHVATPSPTALNAAVPDPVRCVAVVGAVHPRTGMLSAAEFK